ncbi:MAG: hypothetical protein HDR55_03500 [Treponema sp.]|nr:hypothetical protein [Treponema sp.]MBD5406293.1 hypothetical protein [Treponema sp.]
MTIIDAIIDAVKEQLNLMTKVVPQTADTSTEHIELSFIDCEPNGSNCTLTFSASYITGGTHKHWLEKTISAKRRLRQIEDSFMPISLNGSPLRAYWKSNASPQWVYDEADGGMNVYYKATWTVTIDCPEELLSEEETE